MKALIEKRAKLMAELDAMDEKLGEGIETRNVSQEDINAMNQKLKEVKEIDAQIEQQKETRNLKNTKEMKVEEIDMELKNKVLNVNFHGYLLCVESYVEGGLVGWLVSDKYLWLAWNSPCRSDCP